MKNLYTFITFFLVSLSMFSQGYEFSVVHNSNYNFSIRATPDFNATNTDISDIGFALMLPAGSADVTNLTQFNGRAWTATQVTEAQFLTVAGVNSGGRDGFAMNLPPGQTLLSHTSGVPFTLVSFDVSNMPTSGVLEILLNSDPIAIALGGAIDSFYNSNIDDTTTQNYFSGITPGFGNFMFSTLGIEEEEFSDVTINVYPNPVSSILNISTSSNIEKIEFYNILGKQVLTTKNVTQIDVSSFDSGIYLLKIKTDKGNITKKIVIK